MYSKAYGMSYAGPRIGMLGATTTEDIIEQARGAIAEYVPDQPSQDMAGDIASQLAQTHGEAAGRAAAEQTWQKLRPFVIGGFLLLTLGVAVYIGRKK